jgi:hypothetical protein
MVEVVCRCLRNNPTTLIAKTIVPTVPSTRFTWLMNEYACDRHFRSWRCSSNPFICLVPASDFTPVVKAALAMAEAAW